MDIYEIWDKALKHTEIISSRLQTLMTFQETRVPYVLLSESTINLGDTVVRKGEVLVEKPSLILPPNLPQFDGFEFGKNFKADDRFINFLLVRGISLPSLRYNNNTHALDVFEGKLSSAVKHYEGILQEKEDVATGLIIGPGDCWQFSLLIFSCMQVAKNANIDIRRLLDEYKNKNI